MDLSECEMRGNNKHSLCRLSSTLGQIAGLSLMLMFVKFQITCLQSEPQLRSSVDNLRLDSALDEKFSELLLLCDTETEPHGEEVHVTMEAEIRVIQLQVKECRLLAHHQRRDSSLQVSEGVWPSPHLDFVL